MDIGNEPLAHVAPSLEVDEYIAQRVRRRAPAGCGIVPGSFPVVSFGDVRTARIATLSINPSVAEFFNGDVELDGPQRRFETLGSLGAMDAADLTDEQVAAVVERCYGYFAPSGNPYWTFFRPLNRVLEESVGASYEDGSAVHLDLVQWATDPLWNKLSSAVQHQLLQDDLDFLQSQLAVEGIHLVLMNGMSVIDQVKKASISLAKVADLDHGAAAGSMWRGQQGDTVFLGWNQFFPHGGISADRREQIVEHIRAVDAELTPAARSTQSGTIERGRVVTSKAELAAVLREWATTGESTIGDVGTFSGTPWLKVELDSVTVVLNADTKRSAVRALLTHFDDPRTDGKWLVVENIRGRINKVVFNPIPGPSSSDSVIPGPVVPGWYAYTTKPFSTRTEL